MITTQMYSFSVKKTITENPDMEAVHEFRRKFEDLFAQQMVKHFGEDLLEHRNKVLYTKNEVANQIQMCYTDVETGTILLMHTITIDMHENHAIFDEKFESEYPLEAFN